MEPLKTILILKGTKCDELVTTSNGCKLRQYTHIVEDDIQQPTST
jgi:hypothetical protein